MCDVGSTSWAQVLNLHLAGKEKPPLPWLPPSIVWWGDFLIDFKNSLWWTPSEYIIHSSLVILAESTKENSNLILSELWENSENVCNSLTKIHTSCTDEQWSQISVTNSWRVSVKNPQNLGNLKSGWVNSNSKLLVTVQINLFYPVLVQIWEF